MRKRSGRSLHLGDERVKDRQGENSSFGTCEVKNWLEVLNTWIFEGRGWL